MANKLKDFRYYYQICEKYRATLQKILAQHSASAINESYQVLLAELADGQFSNELERIAEEHHFSTKSVLETYVMGILGDSLIKQMRLKKDEITSKKD